MSPKSHDFYTRSHQVKLSPGKCQFGMVVHPRLRSSRIAMSKLSMNGPSCQYILVHESHLLPADSAKNTVAYHGPYFSGLCQEHRTLITVHSFIVETVRFRIVPHRPLI
jgi:hypothetical protein